MRVFLSFDVTKIVNVLLWLIPLVIGGIYIYIHRRK